MASKFKDYGTYTPRFADELPEDEKPSALDRYLDECAGRHMHASALNARNLGYV